MNRVVACFEGPQSYNLRGFNHWLTLTSSGERLSAVGQSWAVKRDSAARGTPCFELGTWEAPGACCARGFAPIRAEILDSLQHEQGVFL